jgi:hypothetical protein
VRGKGGLKVFGEMRTSFSKRRVLKRICDQSHPWPGISPKATYEKWSQDRGMPIPGRQCFVLFQQHEVIPLSAADYIWRKIDLWHREKAA